MYGCLCVNTNKQYTLLKLVQQETHFLCKYTTETLMGIGSYCTLTLTHSSRLMSCQALKQFFFSDVVSHTNFDVNVSLMLKSLSFVTRGDALPSLQPPSVAACLWGFFLPSQYSVNMYPKNPKKKDSGIVHMSWLLWFFQDFSVVVCSLFVFYLYVY